MSQFQIENNGIGGTPFLTFTVDITQDKDFTQSDLDNNLTACVISNNNEVGMGNPGDKLLGRVGWVSQELQDGTRVPALCAVQARGVARFKYDYNNPPVVNGMIEIAGGGKVRRTSRDGLYSPNGHMYRGQVLSVDEGNQTCDVWLG
jgi:hypothetical protein